MAGSHDPGAGSEPSSAASVATYVAVEGVADDGPGEVGGARRVERVRADVGATKVHERLGRGDGGGGDGRHGECGDGEDGESGDAVHRCAPVVLVEETTVPRRA